MLTSIAIILLFGLLVGWIFSKMKLPSLLGMIIVGIVLSPHCLNLVDDSILTISGDLRQIVVCCNDCLYPWKFDHQHFLLCDRSVAPGDCRLLHLLHRKGTVDFPGYPRRYGINGDPYNLPVGMGGCKT